MTEFATGSRVTVVHPSHMLTGYAVRTKYLRARKVEGHTGVPIATGQQATLRLHLVENATLFCSAFCDVARTHGT